MSTAQSALADEEVDDNNNNVDNSDDSDCGEDEYAVERILGRRRTGDGKKYEYKIKWQGYDEITWEPEENVQHCQMMVTEFELEQKRRRKEALERLMLINPSDAFVGAGGAGGGDGDKEEEEKREEKEEEEEDCDGFEKGLEPLRIVGATREKNKMLFLVQWKRTDKADLVTAAKAKEKIPQLVIQFYQERLHWSEKRSKKEET